MFDLRNTAEGVYRIRYGRRSPPPRQEKRLPPSPGADGSVFASRHRQMPVAPSTPDPTDTDMLRHLLALSLIVLTAACQDADSPSSPGQLPPLADEVWHKVIRGNSSGLPAGSLRLDHGISHGDPPAPFMYGRW